MNINFNGVQEQSTKPKMKPGIYEVEITGIVEGKANNGTPTIEMGFVTTNGQYEHTEKFAANPIVSAGKEKSALDMPESSNVLQYFTEDGSKVSIRPSGTEPKIKFYIEVKGDIKSRADYDKSNAAADEKIKAVMTSLGI